MVKEGQLNGVLIVSPGFRNDDERGYFRETFHLDQLEQALGRPWVRRQENEAVSKKGVVRGVHIAPWRKLVQVQHGEAYAVLFDARPDSNTFGQVEEICLTGENGVRVLVPGGVGNSYYAARDNTKYTYQVDAYFNQCLQKGYVELGLNWQDPQFNFRWPRVMSRDLV